MTESRDEYNGGRLLPSTVEQVMIMREAETAAIYVINGA